MGGSILEADHSILLHPGEAFNLKNDERVHIDSHGLSRAEIMTVPFQLQGNGILSGI
jgi:hypothetical protein